MNILTDPYRIEEKSMEIIRQGLNKVWSEDELPIVERLIHTSGDPSLEDSIFIHPRAIEAGLSVIQNGGSVICDVEMARTGINKRLLHKFGASAECFLNTKEVELKSQEWGLTRTMTAIRLYAHKLKDSIVAVGNAPTALFEILSLAANPETRPALIIGVPVGFVGAKESKEALYEHQEFSSILVHGTRGGSPLAAASVNALLKIADRKEVIKA